MSASTPRLAAFFDLDKTIIASSSALAFSRSFYAGGLINRRSVVRSAFAQRAYFLGGAGHSQTERVRAFLSDLSAGWSVDAVRQIVADAVDPTVTPLVFAEALDLLREHQAAGHDVIIVSASAAAVVEPIGQLLGADDVIATQLEIVDGHYTGVITSYVYADAKAAAISALAAERGYDLSRCYAYSDSDTDLPMLELVGNPSVVNPDKELRRIAAEHGWPILQFARPVALRPRVEPRTVALGLVGVAAVAALAWAIIQRKSRESSTPA